MLVSTQPGTKIAARPFLTARWSHLLMANFVVDPDLLRAYVPRGIELDDHHGQCFVSIVGFLFEQASLFGWRIPGYQKFEEVNLRFYVRRPLPDGDRRGVVFVKEIVPHRATAAVARWFYNQNFVTLPMRYHVDDLQPFSRRVEYRWLQNGTWNSISANLEGKPAAAEAGSDTEFIAEHYWAYTAMRDGGCMEYAVEHPPWRVCTPTESTIDVDAASTYGPAWTEVLGSSPHSVFVAEGSPVNVCKGVRI